MMSAAIVAIECLSDQGGLAPEPRQPAHPGADDVAVGPAYAGYASRDGNWAGSSARQSEIMPLPPRTASPDTGADADRERIFQSHASLIDVRVARDR